MVSKNDGKNIDWCQKEMAGRMHKMIKQLLKPFTWEPLHEPDVAIIKRIVRKL